MEEGKQMILIASHLEINVQMNLHVHLYKGTSRYIMFV